jgi:cell wall assembly regulator SMI1
MKTTHTDNLWSRLRAMCMTVNPNQLNGGLLPAATDAQIAVAERILGVPFPEDLREAYRHFNGMMTKGFFELFPGHFRWMPLSFTQTHRPQKTPMWSPAALPRR